MKEAETSRTVYLHNGFMAYAYLTGRQSDSIQDLRRERVMESNLNNVSNQVRDLSLRAEPRRSGKGRVS